jgi:hypothetical protein
VLFDVRGSAVVLEYERADDFQLLSQKADSAPDRPLPGGQLPDDDPAGAASRGDGALPGVFGRVPGWE